MKNAGTPLGERNAAQKSNVHAAMTASDLRIDLEAKVARTASFGSRFVILCGIALLVCIGIWMGRTRRGEGQTAG